MSHLIACVFSCLFGVTATVVLFVRAEEKCVEIYQAERSANLRLAFDRGYAEGQLLIVTADRNALREKLAGQMIEWWKIPAAVDDDQHERIPAPAVPFPIPTK
ncbi:unnamed protein product [Gemmataceae bacterium]|nr:unnamed protein product [Gemmataceae bacterium]VTU00974.1 unnamed protein product [Gemmataceae bacterium]